MGSGVGVVLNKSTWSLDSLFQMNGVSGVVNFILIVFIFLRIIAIIRVAKDIFSRTQNSGLQTVSILLVTFLTPILGLPLYFVIRPIYHKKDLIPWRESCALNLVTCANCHTLNPKEYECCISCGEKLKINCKECGQQYPLAYAYCPICGAPNIE
ncbi:MAG: zinc ribbon domain-containing protein [Candidatus Absconditabacterales bacterium]